MSGCFGNDGDTPHLGAAELVAECENLIDSDVQQRPDKVLGAALRNAYAKYPSSRWRIFTDLKSECRVCGM